MFGKTDLMASDFMQRNVANREVEVAPGTVDKVEKAGSPAGELLMVVNTTASRCDHPLQGNGTSYNPTEFTRDESDANRRVVRVVG